MNFTSSFSEYIIWAADFLWNGPVLVTLLLGSGIYFSIRSRFVPIYYFGHALKLSVSKPENSIYIGDHQIDIKAGERANMLTGAAAYGYIPQDDNVEKWKADYVFEEANEMIALIQ